MTAIASDFDALNLRLRQLRGDAPNGRYFRKDKDGKYELVEDGHDWAWNTARCARCYFTLLELEEGIAPKVCPGGLPKGRTKLFENERFVTYMMPDGQRYVEQKPDPEADKNQGLHVTVTHLGPDYQPPPSFVERVSDSALQASLDWHADRERMRNIPYAPPRVDITNAMAEVNALYREMYEELLGTLTKISNGVMAAPPFVPYEQMTDSTK